ncbi:MAG: hypothetical protein EBR82_11350 [Caulobacteraceae bacterium]|nr:hypothetical protein [Caulobacteraceae bacterium]
MAKFILTATPASFTRSGDIVLVAVRFKSAPLLRKEVEVKNEFNAVRIMDAECEKLDAQGVPYAARLRLADKRAPNGMKSWQLRATHRDRDLGQIA